MTFHVCSEYCDRQLMALTKTQKKKKTYYICKTTKD